MYMYMYMDMDMHMYMYYVFGCSIHTNICVYVSRSSISYEIFTFTAIGAQDQMGAEVFPLLLPSDAAATQLDDRSFSKIEGYTVKSWMV